MMDDIFQELVRAKIRLDRLANLMGGTDPPTLDLMRLSALLVKSRVGLVAQMLEKRMVEKGGDREPEDGPTDN